MKEGITYIIITGERTGNIIFKCRRVVPSHLLGYIDQYKCRRLGGEEDRVRERRLLGRESKRFSVLVY
jgi:hypothetical protein